MDLTTSYPASVHDTMHGIVQLKRTLDKAKALAHGNIGEYHYNCPMDVHLFTFLGIDHEALLDVVKTSNDMEVSEYVAPFVHAKSEEEVDAFNKDWVKQGPAPGSDGEKFFLGLRQSLAPDRTDITNWPDLLDLDEKRPVPHRALA